MVLGQAQAVMAGKSREVDKLRRQLTRTALPSPKKPDKYVMAGK